MKRSILSFAVACAGLAFASHASATVLTFDDIGADGFVPASYGGLDWSASDWSVFGGAQDPYSAHSGDYRATTGYGDDDAASTIGLAKGDTFQGAWFSGYIDAPVTFKLYYAGNLVATSSTLLPSSAPTFLASGYAGLVDKVVVSSPSQGGYVMDDFTFTPAVPEPASPALLLAGLGAVAVAARRRARRA